MLAALLALCFHLGQFLVAAWSAVRFPYELDYGEGIVWQQALLMVRGQGYGAIDALPAIVFHYPPVFHGLSAAAASLTGIDQLAAGRLVSVAATLVAGLFAALIVRRSVSHQAGPAAAALCALIGGLVALSVWPVGVWAPLMRVDMVALAFSVAGVYFGLRSLARPSLVVVAALCFVAAVFTKQTAIAGAGATYLTLLLLRPRTAGLGIAVSILAGLAVLGLLAWSTEGGFLRHIFLYNINRFEWSRLLGVVEMVRIHFLYFAFAAIGTALRIRARLPAYRDAASLAELRRRLLAAPADAMFLMLLVYLALATLTLLTVAKSGSSINYFVEWLFITGILLGLLAVDAARAALPRPGEAGAPEPARASAMLRVGLPAAIALQVLLIPDTPHARTMDAGRRAELAELGAMMRATSQPIISDDMVLLLRNGKQVQWEPAIFAELASTGFWDERPFIARIRSRSFAFFVTVGNKGDRLFDSRYTPGVADAIDAAYGVERELAGYTIHFPGPPPR